MESIPASIDGYENHFLLTIIEKLYLKTESADVYFVFGDDDKRERVPAHKWLLAAGNDVFKAMFYGDLKENGDVEITDASADAFKEFLQFFYRSKVNLTVENAFDVVNLCKKYDVTACLNICEKFLRDELTRCNDSVCSAYGLAIYFDLKVVKELCEAKIVNDTEAVLSSASFLECNRSVLSRILTLDELSCSEVSVFHACMNWVKAKAKQKELTRELVRVHLGDLFYEIRFGSMTMETLAGLTSSYGKVFSFDEYQEIVQMNGINDFQPKRFKRDHRQVLLQQWNDAAAIHCERYGANSNRGYTSVKIVEKTTFTSNKPILLGAIRFDLVLYHGVPVEMAIYKISHDGAIKALYSDKFIHNIKMYGKIKLTTPILIKPGFKYEIQLKQPRGGRQEERFGFVLKDKVQLPGSDVTIKFIGKNKTGGIFHNLVFNLISEA